MVRTTPAACAHIDESGVRLADGRRLYGLAAVLTSSADHAEITAQLSALLLAERPYLHHYDETSGRRLKIADAIAALPLDGVVVATVVTTDQAQERARARLMARLLPRLQCVENVRRVMIEHRQGGDKHDRRVIDRLRRSRHVTSELRIDHAEKSASAGLWVADFVIGSYFAARYHAEREPWEIVASAHLVEVVSIDS